MTADPRILTPEQIGALRALGATDSLVGMAVGPLLRHIEALTEQAQLDHLVAEAADALVTAKRAAEVAFPQQIDPATGLERMATLLRSSGAHAQLAASVARLGQELARAVDHRAGRSS